MVCCGSCIKFLLKTFNFLFFLAGAGLLAVTIYVLVEDPNVKYKSILEGLSEGLYYAAVYILLLIAILVFVTGFLGWCGAKKESSCMLNMYSCIIIFVIITQITAGLLMYFYQDEISKYLKEDMTEQVQTRYVHEDSLDDTSKTWNAMQQDMDCCGGESYVDYKYSNFSQNEGYPVPYTCCVEGAKANTTARGYCMKEAMYYNATEGMTMPIYLYPRGCYYGIMDWLKENSVIIYSVVGVITCIQIFTLILACCVKPNKVGPV